MDVDVAETPPERVEADVLGVGVTEALELPSLARAPLAGLAEDGELRGERGGPPRLVLCGPAGGEAAEEARRAAIVADWTNRCRDLVNAPANELTPARLADEATEIATKLGVEIDVIGRVEIE